MRRFGRCVSGVAALLAGCAGDRSTQLPSVTPVSVATRPAEWSDRSYYLAMPDGVRLAVSLWFPGGRPEGKHPVLLVQTRYGRAITFIHGESGRYRSMAEKGFVVAIVDTRGSTASFGDRSVEIGPDEVRDMDTIIAHLKTRSWSNGQVFAQGVSYMADTADMATGSRARLTGAVVRQSDFDPFLQLFAPGGVANDMMMNLWGGDTLLRDYGKSLDPKEGLDCSARAQDCPKLWPRLQAVDEDPDHAMLRAAIAGRRHHWKPEDYRLAEYRDDKGANGFTMFSSGPAARLADIGREAVPTQYWGSWMDAGTAEGTLARYRALPNVPMEVWITANNHGGDRLTDPFFPDATAPLPAFDAQWAEVGNFLSRVRAGDRVARVIHYYVLGANTFRSTTDWPPADVKRTVFRLSAGGALSGDAADAGEDHYEVDFAATTGDATRWTTQLGVPAAYGDRREASRHLLTYTSEPFTQDMELVGTPAVRLFVATATADPAFFAYLEDVAPDGRVTYITEGLFRAVHRKPARLDTLPYLQPVPAHSFARGDAMPMVPGVVAEVSFPTFPVAALLKAGHRLRLSLAGADASAFRRYSQGKSEHWRVQRGGLYPSSLSVDLRPWRSAR